MCFYRIQIPSVYKILFVLYNSRILTLKNYIQILHAVYIAVTSPKSNPASIVKKHVKIEIVRIKTIFIDIDTMIFVGVMTI